MCVEAGHAYSHNYCRKTGLKALALNYCRTFHPISSIYWTVEIVHGAANIPFVALNSKNLEANVTDSRHPSVRHPSVLTVFRKVKCLKISNKFTTVIRLVLISISDGVPELIASAAVADSSWV